MTRKVVNLQAAEAWANPNEELAPDGKSKASETAFSSLFEGTASIDLSKVMEEQRTDESIESEQVPEASSSCGEKNRAEAIKNNNQREGVVHHGHTSTPLPLRPYTTYLFIKMQLYLLVTLLVLFSVPVEPYDSVRLFNRSFWLLIIFVALLSFAAVLLQIVFVVRLCRVYTIDNPPSLMRFALLCLAPQVSLWMTLSSCIVIMILCGIFPIPFYAVFFGGFGTVFVGSLSVWKGMRLVYPELDPSLVRRSIIFSCKMLVAPLFAFIMEVPFILGMYLLDSKMQMMVIFGFQVMNLTIKFFTRIALRKNGPLFGLSTRECNLLILSPNIYMEFVLQFYVSVVSPNIKDPKVYVFFFAIEAFSLALNPILDSDTVRRWLRHFLKKIFPSQSRFIDDNLTIGTLEGRIFSIQNISSCFFVRMTSAICYMFLVTVMFFGFNKNIFVNTQDLTMKEYQFSMGYCACSIVLAVIQLVITIKIIYKHYRIDLSITWEEAFRDNFFGMYSAIVLVFCHVIVTISPQFYGLAFLIGK